MSHYTWSVNTGHPTIRYWICRMSNGLSPNYKQRQSAFSFPRSSWVDAQLTSDFRERKLLLFARHCVPLITTALFLKFLSPKACHSMALSSVFQLHLERQVLRRLGAIA
ncbi:hypothetical protein [Chroococcidiopsis sp. CCALA 051]|uniref:hypothetical protein n=1 Tax=Chroococcidiopsis sp. CCALA 051 TaxID=869949 RepID=UPI0011B24B24|nr:hypothetical protein [Chroococcidiopsis sp. CCALA 051]